MKVLLSVVGVLLVGVGILLWSLIPNRRIAGKWGEPEVSILHVRGHHLEDGRGMVLSYFFHLSQEGNLRKPYRSMWGREIATRTHKIALGFESMILDPSGEPLVVLPIESQVTDHASHEGQLYLRTTWSYYSEDGVYRVGAEFKDAVEILPEEMPEEELSFLPLDLLEATSPEIAPIISALEARLREQYLQTPDSKNRYKSVPRPKRR